MTKAQRTLIDALTEWIERAEDDGDGHTLVDIAPRLGDHGELLLSLYYADDTAEEISIHKA